MIVGGYADIHYARPRFTKDLDLWLEPSEENAKRVLQSFSEFGIPLLGVTEADFATPGTQFSIGVSPSELDFLTTIPGLEFDSAWANRETTDSEGFAVHYVGKSDLIKAKETANRPQDLADIDSLNSLSSEEES